LTVGRKYGEQRVKKQEERNKKKELTAYTPKKRENLKNRKISIKK
jgi:hypothetical protein